MDNECSFCDSKDINEVTYTEEIGDSGGQVATGLLKTVCKSCNCEYISMDQFGNNMKQWLNAK